METGELWNCTASSLQALALSPRSEISNSASPMISPRSSPRSIRRSATPTVGVTAMTVPPPIPPRRSSPTLEQIMIPTTSQTQPSVARNGTATNNNEMSGHRHHNNGMNEAQSVTNLSHNAVDSLHSHLAKSNSMHEMHRQIVGEADVIELSSPESIFGLVTSDCINIIKTQTRHQSCPTSKSKKQINCPVKSSTTPNFSSNEIIEEPAYENVHIDVPPKTKEKFNPLTSKDNSSVCYENLNMDYIKKLVSEGYSRDAVIKALGITRNNVDMACDILHEFGTKHG